MDVKRTVGRLLFAGAFFAGVALFFGVVFSRSLKCKGGYFGLVLFPLACFAGVELFLGVLFTG